MSERSLFQPTLKKGGRGALNIEEGGKGGLDWVFRPTLPDRALEAYTTARDTQHCWENLWKKKEDQSKNKKLKIKKTNSNKNKKQPLKKTTSRHLIVHVLPVLLRVAGALGVQLYVVACLAHVPCCFHFLLPPVGRSFLCMRFGLSFWALLSIRASFTAVLANCRCPWSSQGSNQRFHQVFFREGCP